MLQIFAGIAVIIAGLLIVGHGTLKRFFPLHDHGHNFFLARDEEAGKLAAAIIADNGKRGPAWWKIKSGNSHQLLFRDGGTVVGWFEDGSETLCGISVPTNDPVGDAQRALARLPSSYEAVMYEPLVGQEDGLQPGQLVALKCNAWKFVIVFRLPGSKMPRHQLTRIK